MNFLSVAARKIRTAAGTLLSIGTISDGQTLVRSGTSVVGSSTAVSGSLGSTDNALLRADGAGGQSAQGSAATLDDIGQLDIGGWRTMPVVSTTWTSGGVVTMDLGTLQNGDYFCSVKVWLESITVSSIRKVWTENLALRRTAGPTVNILHQGSTGSLGSFGPSLSWAVSSDDMQLTITSAGRSGEICYQVTLMYCGVLDS